MSKNSQFEKFINKTKGSVIKEKIKQEKKQVKKKRAEGIEKRFEEKRKMKLEAGVRSSESGVGSREKGVRSSAFSVQSSESGVQGHESGVGNREFRDQSSKSGVKSRESGDKRSAFSVQNSEAGVEKREAEDRKITGTKNIQPGNRKAAPESTASIPTPVFKNASTGQSSEVVGMPVNKYIAHSGICSRRDAALLVKQGDVTVNGEVISDPGTRISDTDLVKVKGKKIIPSRNYQYILLNKPKDYITTLEDPQGRKTVLDLIRHATNERVYPVGRLDRNTSGLLLLTNDGDLAQTLAHPKHEIKKIYEVKLDKDLSKNDFDTLLNGVMLEDGFIAPDALAYADAKDKSIIGIEIHSGRNRIVRRIFEKLGYDVRGLDRVMYAGLTKKNIQRGKWRFLTEKEVRILKHFNKVTAKQ